MLRLKPVELPSRGGAATLAKRNPERGRREERRTRGKNVEEPAWARR